MINDKNIYDESTAKKIISNCTVMYKENIKVVKKLQPNVNIKELEEKLEGFLNKDVRDEYVSVYGKEYLQYMNNTKTYFNDLNKLDFNLNCFLTDIEYKLPIISKEQFYTSIKPFSKGFIGTLSYLFCCITRAKRILKFYRCHSKKEIDVLKDIHDSGRTFSDVLRMGDLVITSSYQCHNIHMKYDKELDKAVVKIDSILQIDSDRHFVPQLFISVPYNFTNINHYELMTGVKYQSSMYLLLDMRLEEDKDDIISFKCTCLTLSKEEKGIYTTGILLTADSNSCKKLIEVKELYVSLHLQLDSKRYIYSVAKTKNPSRTGCRTRIKNKCLRGLNL